MTSVYNVGSQCRSRHQSLDSDSDIDSDPDPEPNSDSDPDADSDSGILSQIYSFFLNFPQRGMVYNYYALFEITTDLPILLSCAPSSSPPPPA